MTKIKRLHLKKKINETYLFGCEADVQISPSTYMNGLNGYDIFINGKRQIELIPMLTGERLVNFTENIDSEYDTEAKTQNIIFHYNGTQELGKVSVRDGNYPPPYTPPSQMFAYDQPAFSALFTISEIVFTQNVLEISKYDMKVVLVTGTGAANLPTYNTIEIGEVSEEGNIAIMLGVPQVVNSTITLEYPGVLGENVEIAFVIFKYDAEQGGYNRSNNQDHLMKKGVIKLL